MIKFLKLFVFLLNHPQVGKYKKIIFVGFPILYLIMPDLIPGIIDDLIIIIIGFLAFTKIAQKDVKVPKDSKTNGDDDVIDVDAKVIKDE